MKRLMILLILVTCLCAQDNWSSARQLSRDGTYPSLNFGVPTITVDNNGTIHAFWIQMLEVDGSWTNGFYDQIEYRKSTDGGITWSTTENLTPEYSAERIYYMKAVCDSENNVHLVYMRGSEGYEVLYKKFDGSVWTEPVLIGYGTSYLRMNIDCDDRIYVTWMVGRYAYFAYCDDDIWSDYNQIGTDEYCLENIKFDNENLLYAVGDCRTYLKPYLFIYDKLVESWIKIEEIPIDSTGFGAACVISDDNEELFVNLSQGTYADSKDFHLSMEMNTGEYSFPYEYGDDNANAPEREMYIDNNNYLHLFELHFYDLDYVSMGLIHNIGKNKTWETIVIDSSSTSGYSEPSTTFYKKDSKFHLLYMKSDLINHITRIYFRSKLNTTSIESNDDILIDNYKLNQNYPNPFNNQTKISYSLSQTCEVELSVFNPKGQFISVLVNSKQNKGQYSITYNADKLNSGVYYYQLKTDGILRSIKRMIYLK
ncbi:MAG: T9SS type A sorting domain-containing protein [Candidatus Delongbacteria bacterium]